MRTGGFGDPLFPRLTPDPRLPPGEVQPPSRITDHLWQSGQPVDFAWASAVGVELVLDLAEPYQHPDHRLLTGVQHVKWSVLDGPLPDELVLDGLVRLVVSYVEAGRSVLVHCAWGRNRSSLVTGLALCALTGCSGREAVERIRSERVYAFNNPAFEEYLVTRFP